jgi:hypothetical protein
MEVESCNSIPFLDVPVTRRQTTLVTTVYKQPTHTGRYLSFRSNLPPHGKRGLMQRLFDRAAIVCQERQYLLDEIKKLKHDLQLNDYPQSFIDSAIKYKDNRQKTEHSRTCPKIGL